MDDFATGYLAGQDGGNNNGGFFGNEGLWAVIILAIIFGWGNYGNGRNGGDNGMNSYIPYLVGTGATGQGGADTRAALSEGFYQQDTSRSLAGIQSGICSLGYDQLAQMNGVNTNIANGFAGVNSAICQLGYQNAQLVNGLERSVSNGDNAISLAIMQEGNARQAGQTALGHQSGGHVRQRYADHQYPCWRIPERREVLHRGCPEHPGHDHHQRPCCHYHRCRYDRIPSDRLQLRSGNRREHPHPHPLRYPRCNVCDRHRHVQVSWLLLPFPRWRARVHFLRRYRLWARLIFAA